MVPVRIVVALGLAAWVANAAIAWGTAPMLGHDEAQYALAASDLLAGEEPRWAYYLSQGMHAIAVPGVLAGGSEHALRFLPALAGIGFVLAAAVLARRIAGPAAAAWTIAVLAATSSIAVRCADLLSDVPAAACLLAGTAIVIGELTRGERLRWRLAAAAPWLAAAFYLRYGSVIPIAVIGAVAIGFGWRAIASRPAPALAAIGLFGVLLVPHLVYSTIRLGSPLAIILEGSAVLERAASGVALETYVARNPFLYYGAVTTPVVIAGMLSVLRGFDRRSAMAWAIAAGSFVGIGLTPIAQARYVMFPIALFAILGVDRIERAIAARPPRARRALGIAAAAVVAVGWLVVAWSLTRVRDTRARRSAGALAAIEAIRSDARGARCHVVCQHTTQTEWYTGCRGVHAVPIEALGRDRVYGVRDRVGEHQPDLDAMPGRHVTILERAGLVKVIRIEPST